MLRVLHYGKLTTADKPLIERQVKVLRGPNRGVVGTVFWRGAADLKHKIGIATSEQLDENGLHRDVVWTRITKVELVGTNPQDGKGETL